MIETPQLNPKNIIIRMPNWLGDFVMATPVIADLHAHWPEAKITAMCQGAVGSLLEQNPHVHEVFAFKRAKGWFSRQAKEEIVQPLCQGQYDLGILLTNSFSSAWWFWRGKIKNRIGYAANCRHWLLNKSVPFPKERNRQHLVMTYKNLLVSLGIPLSNTPPTLYLSDEEKLAAARWLVRHPISPASIIVGINPGAAYGSAKCWLPARFREVVEKLLENPKVIILFFGDKVGAPLVEEISRFFPPNRVINLAGQTNLRELMAFIQACHVFLTNDSGPMHIASALGTPLTALFGSTDDYITGPYGGGEIIHKHTPCSPCYRRECPIDFRCMTRIETHEVYHKLQSILLKRQSDGSSFR